MVLLRIETEERESEGVLDEVEEEERWRGILVVRIASISLLI